MKKLSIILAAITVCVAIQSCNTVKDIGAFSTGSSRIEYTMSDFEYLGQSEVSVDYNRYLGIFQRIETVNGSRYVPGNDVKLHINNMKNGNLKLAVAKVSDDFPQADYFIITRETETSVNLFLGSSKNVKAVVRAYKLKD
ncbi:MAG: hypothetical protein IJ150_03955 [Bacteroidales bacterium]|nr:hypothetical protein [Bacteroidales bacterium]